MEFFLLTLNCAIFSTKNNLFGLPKIVCHVITTAGDVLGAPNSKWRIT